MFSFSSEKRFPDLNIEKGIDLKLLSENTGLFFKQKKKTESQIARADVKKSQVEVSYKKIGQIKNIRFACDKRSLFTRTVKL